MSEAMSTPTPSAPQAPSAPTNTAPQTNTSPQTPNSASPAPQSPGPQIQESPPKPEYIVKKINGREVRMTQQEADDYLSMSYAANERFQEAAKMRKEVEARESQYQKDPVKAFLDYAERAKLSPEQKRAALEKYYSEQYIEPETLTPQQRELKALQEYKARHEQREQEQQLTQHEQMQQRMVQEQINHVTEEIVSALDSAKEQLPSHNKFLTQRMAFYMQKNLENGWNAPKELIVRQVVNEHKGIVGDFLKDATMEQIVNYAGQEFVDRILKHSLESLRANRNKKAEPFTQQADDATSMRPDGKIDYSEVNRRLRDMRSGRYVVST